MTDTGKPRYSRLGYKQILLDKVYNFCMICYYFQSGNKVLLSYVDKY